MNIYFVRGYGWHESGNRQEFNKIIEVEDISADGIYKAIEVAAELSPFRKNKEIIIENITDLN